MRRHRWPLFLGFLIINMSKRGNPQLENGYTKIANELLEGILLSDLTKDEMKITFAIIRQTYGYSRKIATISISLFQKLTGLDRRNVVRAINAMTYSEKIGRSTGAKMKYGKPVYNYWIIKQSYCRITPRARGNMTTEAIVVLPPIKEKKENLKKGRKELVEKLSVK